MTARRAAVAVLGISTMGFSVLAVPGSTALAGSAFEPAAPGISNYLSATSALSSSDIWAVGAFYSQQYWHPLVEHFDGSTWTTIPSPRPRYSNRYLTGVSALSPTDVWAVGYYVDRGDPTQKTLILHWDGTRWTQIPSPSPASRGGASTLSGVTAVAAADAWAVGTYTRRHSDKYAELILHWNGSSWATVRGLEPARRALSAIDAVSATDVWAVGSVSPGARPHPGWEHWDGTSWTSYDQRLPSTKRVHLTAVDGVSSNDIWAVGDSGDTGYVIHWDGTSWHKQATLDPDGPGELTALDDISVVSPTDIWVVGSHDDLDQTLIEHWDGSTWTQVPSPNKGPSGNVLNAVTAFSADDAWAVGETRIGDATRQVFERWDGSAWNVYRP